MPNSLFQAFLKVSETWEDDDLYAHFEKERIKYMGDAAEDKIESGKLTVCLSRMKRGTLNLDYTDKV